MIAAVLHCHIPILPRIRLGTKHVLRLIALVLAAMAVLFAQPHGALAEGATRVVRYDMGGELDARIAMIQDLRASGVTVEIRGTCVSACTLYLGLPNTCVSADAKLGFHGPRSSLPGIPLPRAQFDRVTEEMAAYYPGAIRGWFLSTARQVTDQYYLISGSQAIAMGAQPCA